MGSNRITGTIPPSISGLRHLLIFFVQSNGLSGSLTAFVNATTQKALTNIDVSSNQFTGPIPTEPFKFATLQSFAAVSNCLTGSIPVEICGAPSLVALAMDGLSTATSCQER